MKIRYALREAITRPIKIKRPERVRVIRDIRDEVLLMGLGVFGALTMSAATLFFYITGPLFVVVFIISMGFLQLCFRASSILGEERRRRDGEHFRMYIGMTWLFREGD